MVEPPDRALRFDRSSTAFAVLRHSGLVAITITAVVFHAVLSHTLNLKNWDAVGNQLVHTVVLVMAIVGWLMQGPRNLVSARFAWLSMVFPVCWVAFTLIRGAVVHWYPYPFIDVTQLGYGRAAVNCVWLTLLMLGLAGGATALEGRLARTAPAAPSS